MRSCARLSCRTLAQARYCDTDRNGLYPPYPTDFQGRRMCALKRDPPPKAVHLMTHSSQAQ